MPSRTKWSTWVTTVSNRRQFIKKGTSNFWAGVASASKEATSRSSKKKNLTKFRSKAQRNWPAELERTPIFCRRSRSEASRMKEEEDNEMSRLSQITRRAMLKRARPSENSQANQEARAGTAWARLHIETLANLGASHRRRQPKRTLALIPSNLRRSRWPSVPWRSRRSLRERSKWQKTINHRVRTSRSHSRANKWTRRSRRFLDSLWRRKDPKMESILDGEITPTPSQNTTCNHKSRLRIYSVDHLVTGHRFKTWTKLIPNAILITWECNKSTRSEYGSSKVMPSRSTRRQISLATFSRITVEGSKQWTWWARTSSALTLQAGRRWAVACCLKDSYQTARQS